MPAGDGDADAVPADLCRSVPPVSDAGGVQDTLYDADPAAVCAALYDADPAAVCAALPADRNSLANTNSAAVQICAGLPWCMAGRSPLDRRPYGWDGWDELPVSD